jgi:hypothetical protein
MNEGCNHYVVPAGKHVYGRSSQTKDTLLFHQRTQEKVLSATDG